MESAGGLEDELAACLERGVGWDLLPPEVKAHLGGATSALVEAAVAEAARSHRPYEECSARHEVGFEIFALLLCEYCQEHLLVYPYHLQSVLVGGVPPSRTVTPVAYYREMVREMVLRGETAWDALPNYTASDAGRLLGITRKDYIQLVDKVRIGGAKAGRKAKVNKASLNEALPARPPKELPCEPWWLARCCKVTAEVMGRLTPDEYSLVSWLRTTENRDGPATLGSIGKSQSQALYHKEVIAFDVPVRATDYVFVPTLSSTFVMNRNPSPDSDEHLLYDVFVLADKDRTVDDIAEMLNCDVDAVSDAVSFLLRLGFMKKSGAPTWAGGTTDAATSAIGGTASSGVGLREAMDAVTAAVPASASHKVALLFDSTTVSVLMMGNLSHDLKQHAVTLFEAGRLVGEALTEFRRELGLVRTISGSEGDAADYFIHAVSLKHTLSCLIDGNDGSDAPSIAASGGAGGSDGGATTATHATTEMHQRPELQMLHCASLLNLPLASRVRFLAANFTALIPVTPLVDAAAATLDVLSLIPSASRPAFFGETATLRSRWFTLWLSAELGDGLPVAVFPAGRAMDKLPPGVSKLCTTGCDWNVHVFGLSPSSAESVPSRLLLARVNELLVRGPVIASRLPAMVSEPNQLEIAFRSTSDDSGASSLLGRIEEVLAMPSALGYVSLAKGEDSWYATEVHFGVPFHDTRLNAAVCAAAAGVDAFAETALRAHRAAMRDLHRRVWTYVGNLASFRGKDPTRGVARMFKRGHLPWPSKAFVFDGKSLHIMEPASTS